MVRTPRASDKSRNRCGQIGISAGVLLLPAIILGAAAYAMLPPRGGPAAHDLPPAVRSVAVIAEPAPPSRSDAMAAPASAAALTPAQPAPDRDKPASRETTGRHKDMAQIPQERPIAQERQILQERPIPQERHGVGQAAAPAPAAKPAPAPAGAATYALASAGEETVHTDATAAGQDTDKDLARVMGPVPVRVTVVVAPHAGRDDNAEADLAAADLDSPVAALGAPPVMSPPVLAPDLPTDTRLARPSHPHFHKRFRNSARRPPRDPSRGEAKPRSFSLRGWFQQLGTPQRAPQRG